MSSNGTTDYSSLRKSISGYINKYPSPNKNQNEVWLTELISIKNNKSKQLEYNKLRDTIVLSNGGFAMKYVTRYASLLNDDVSISELFQEACIGLLEAIDTFSLDKNTSFTTYAFFHIRKRIIDFIKKNKIVRAPRDIARNIKHVNNAMNNLLAKKGTTPTALEIKVELKKEYNLVIKESIIDSILILIDLNSASSEQSFISEYKDQVSSAEETGIFNDMEINLKSSINKFPDLLREAIELRYGIGREYSHSPEEIKMMLKLTDKDLEELKE